MAKVLLPTIESPDAVGGIARYLEAIRQTFQCEVRLLHVAPTYRDIFTRVFWQPRTEKDIVIIWINHLLPVGTVGWLWSLISRKPYVIFLHGLDFDLARRNAWKQWLSQRILNRAKHIVTNTQALAKEVRAFVPRAVEPLVVYPVVSDALVSAAQSTPKKHSEQITLVTVARLVSRKGHRKVLQALTQLPEVNYLIVGDGPERRAIEQGVIDYGLQGRVKVITNATDQQLVEIYRSADIFVLPTTKTATDREGFGIAYLEAQLFGLPVIATNHPGVDEAIKNEVTGLLIDDTPEALENALRRLVSDPSLRTHLGDNGPAWVQQNFTRQEQMSKLTACL